VLAAAVKHVATHGWSEEALAKGAAAEGLSAAAHGKFAPVELVEFVAEDCRRELARRVDESADELAAMDGWRPRLKRAVELRLELSLPWHEHRGQALGLMVSSLENDTALPAAVPALAALADELARATVVQDLSEARWHARRAAAAVVYAVTEVRALADSSPGLADTFQFSDSLVDALADAADGPAALRDALAAGAHAAKSLGGAAFSLLPPKAVGALPYLLDLALSRAGSTSSLLWDSMLERFLQSLPPSPVPPPPSSSSRNNTKDAAATDNATTTTYEDSSPTAAAPST